MVSSFHVIFTIASGSRSSFISILQIGNYKRKCHPWIKGITPDAPLRDYLCSGVPPLKLSKFSCGTWEPWRSAVPSGLGALNASLTVWDILPGLCFSSLGCSPMPVMGSTRCPKGLQNCSLRGCPKASRPVLVAGGLPQEQVTSSNRCVIGLPDGVHMLILNYSNYLYRQGSWKNVSQSPCSKQPCLERCSCSISIFQLKWQGYYLASGVYEVLTYLFFILKDVRSCYPYICILQNYRYPH